MLVNLEAAIPAGQIAGPAFMIRHFIHSYLEGLDIEAGFPVKGEFEAKGIRVYEMPEMKVLSRIETGPADQLGPAYQALFGCQDDYGLISDEFCLEVFHDGSPQEGKIEVFMVLHDWEALLRETVEDVLGEEARKSVLPEETFFLEASREERFTWAKEAVDRLDAITDDDQRYEIISRCAHVYPQTQADKLREVYLAARLDGADLLTAVDAVIGFMDVDPGWRPNIFREGRTLYATKNPRDRAAYQKATTDEERRQAYCFCPIVRANLEDGMSESFCYCSAGFERRQWETALGQPVRIEVEKSLLKGDMECQFAIQLPKDQTAD